MANPTTAAFAFWRLVIFLLPLLGFAQHHVALTGKTVTYDFNITWVRADPSGLGVPRPVMGVNGAWPLPAIVADAGDRVVVRAANHLGNETASLHFHGLSMNGSTHMDGADRVSQCAIAPGGSFTYDFIADRAGTFWYHSHVRGQYPDGLRGPMVVHDPEPPEYLLLASGDDGGDGRSGHMPRLNGGNSEKNYIYDEEVVLTVSDWYHALMNAELLPRFLHKTNPSGAEPVPDAALLNDTAPSGPGALQWRVEPGRTYLVRMVNMGAFAGQYVWFEDHEIQVVEVDGVYTYPAPTNMIYLAAAQRCSFLLRTKVPSLSPDEEKDVKYASKKQMQNYVIHTSMDTTLFDELPPALNPNATGYMIYDPSAPLPSPTPVAEFDPLDDVLELRPYDNQPLLPAPDREVRLSVVMDNLADGANYAFFNNITYRAPKVPTLYTALTAGEMATEPAVYGGYTNTFVLEGKGETVQIVVDNLDDGAHPFHLHGHTFQVVHRSEEDAGTWEDEQEQQQQQQQQLSGAPAEFSEKSPIRRDTVVVNGNGNAVLRFTADNPGVWLFHCHIEWHVESGLIATFVEAPLALQRDLGFDESFPVASSTTMGGDDDVDDADSATSEMRKETEKKTIIPSDHYEACAAAGVPVAGNAAGNTEDLLDLTGQNRAPERLPDGFTPRGIVALVFSTLAGILGVLVVLWFGLIADPDAGLSGDDDNSGEEGLDEQRVGLLDGDDDETGVSTTTVYRDGSHVQDNGVVGGGIAGNANIHTSRDDNIGRLLHGHHLQSQQESQQRQEYERQPGVGGGMMMFSNNRGGSSSQTTTHSHQQQQTTGTAAAIQHKRQKSSSSSTGHDAGALLSRQLQEMAAAARSGESTEAAGVVTTSINTTTDTRTGDTATSTLVTGGDGARYTVGREQ